MSFIFMEGKYQCDPYKKDGIYLIKNYLLVLFIFLQQQHYNNQILVKIPYPKDPMVFERSHISIMMGHTLSSG